VAEIQLEKLTKVYSDGTHAVSDLDLEIGDGELVVFVGPSGCGKTTALRMIAGLEPITEGTVKIGGEVVNRLPPKDRDIAMIFQNYALYPHMSARDNMAFGLKLRKVPRQERRKRVDSAGQVLGIYESLAKKPRTLSGGQRQRVAMGRAIVREPQAFLMDEPLSNLDAKLRVQMRAEIARLQRDLHVTTIYVTHDQSEAMTLGHRVAVMRDGFLQQVDTPQRLYDHPANLFVGEFIGSPAMNLVVAKLGRQDGGLVARFGDHALSVPGELVSARPGLHAYVGKQVALGVRPEDFEDAVLVPNSPPEHRLHATVDIREDMGSEVFIHFAAGGKPVGGADVKAAVGAEAVEAEEAQARRQGHLFVARLDRETRAVEKESIELAVDARRMHFFDAQSGEAIYDQEDYARRDRA
jgi:multiple sugar transport system ATP-binding protein